MSNEVPRVHHTIIARFHEIVTGQMLADRQAPPNTVVAPVPCPLCGHSPDNWTHMLLMCEHKDVSPYYTKRHDAAGKALLHHLSDGTMARWLTLTNFGRIDGDPMDQTVPDWLLSPIGKADLRRGPTGEQGIKPDTIILEGWPSDAPPPTGPVSHYRAPNGRKSKLTLHIVELGFCSDLRHRDKYAQKQSHYVPLEEALTAHGWNVHPRTHIITVGVRATVPERNHDVLTGLGITDEKARTRLQEELVRISAKHIAIIITHIRKLHGPQKRLGVG